MPRAAQKRTPAETEMSRTSAIGRRMAGADIPDTCCVADRFENIRTEREARSLPGDAVLRSDYTAARPFNPVLRGRKGAE